MEYIEYMGMEWEPVHSRRAHMGRFLPDDMQPQLPSPGSISYQWAEKWAAKQKTLRGIRDAQRRKRSLLGGWWPGLVEEDERVEYDKAFDRMTELVGRVFEAQETGVVSAGASVFACAEPVVSSQSVARSVQVVASSTPEPPQPSQLQLTGLGTCAGQTPDGHESCLADQACEGQEGEMREELEAADEGKSCEAEQQAAGGAPPEDTPSGSHTGAGTGAQAPGAGNNAGCATISPRPPAPSPFAGATWAFAIVEDQQGNTDRSSTAGTPCQLTSPPFKPTASPRPGQDESFLKPGASAFAGQGQVMAWDEDMVADHGDRALIGTGAASMQPETPGACPRTPLQPSFDEADGGSVAAQAKAGFQAVVAGAALDLEINPRELDYGREEGRRLGSGSFGVVCKGTWRKTTVAVKTFMANGVENHELDAFLSEVSIMSRLRHPNVVQFLGAVLPSQGMPAAIVTEVASRGSLFHVLHRAGHPLTPARRLHMAMDIAKGLNYLHSCKPMIVHRDLKSQNLLVARDWSLKVCDFGMSQVKTTKFLSHGKDIGTCAYMAPEVLRLEPYTEKCDVFSFGVILWELATGDVPWDGENEWCAFGSVGLGGARLSVADVIQPDVKALLMDCWEEEAARRPSFDQILDRLEIMTEITPSARCAARRAHEKASGAAR